MNIDGYCLWFLIGSCSRGQSCTNKHFTESRLTQRLCRRKKTTILVQCAWSGRLAAAMHAWRLIDTLLTKNKRNVDVQLAHEASVYDVGKIFTQCNRTDFLKKAIIDPWPRYGPDCLVESLAQTICNVCMAAQKNTTNNSTLIYEQIFLFTYTGAVADYSMACASKHLHRMMQATNVRVVIVGIDLTDFERGTIARLCTNNTLFTFVESKSTGQPSCDGARLLVETAQKLHANFVLDQYRTVFSL